MASYGTWFLKGFSPLYSTFTPSQGSAHRVRCQEWTESSQDRILTHRALIPCQRDAPQEERVRHDFKPISARASSKICNGIGYDRSVLEPVARWQQHRHIPPAGWKSTKHLLAYAKISVGTAFKNTSARAAHGCTRWSVQASPRRRNKGLQRSPRTVCKGKGWQSTGPTARYSKLGFLKCI